MKRMDPSPMIHPEMDTMLIYEERVMRHGIRKWKSKRSRRTGWINDYLAIQGLYYSKPGEIQEITVSCWIKRHRPTRRESF